MTDKLLPPDPSKDGWYWISHDDIDISAPFRFSHSGKLWRRSSEFSSHNASVMWELGWRLASPHPIPTPEELNAQHAQRDAIAVMTKEKKAIDQSGAVKTAARDLLCVMMAEYLRYHERYHTMTDDDVILREPGPGGFTITAGLIRAANREVGAPEITSAEMVKGPAVSRIFRLKIPWTIRIEEIDAVGDPYQRSDYGNLWLVDYRRSSQMVNDYVTFDTREEAEDFKAAVVAAMQA